MSPVSTSRSLWSLSASALTLAGCATPADSPFSDAGEELSTVSFALDWAPNTNHVGVYVAEALGYFEEAGLEVDILPYGSTPALQLVSAGEADFGIGGQSSVQMARTTGLDVISVYRVTQTDTGRLVTLPGSGLERPADLDGTIGVPEQQATGIVSSDAYLASHPDEARAFVQAVARGYSYAVEHPDEAAQILIEANPDTLGTAEELVHRSMKLMAQEGYLYSPERNIGEADPLAWNEFGAFLFAGGFLTDSSGEPLQEGPDWSEYYTDDFLNQS